MNGLDEVVIERLMRGVRVDSAWSDERVEAARRMLAAGVAPSVASRLAGVSGTRASALRSEVLAAARRVS